MMRFRRHPRLPIVYEPSSRRMFLKGFGTFLAIPFLPSLAEAADADGADVYFIFSLMTHGRHELAWYPQGDWSVEPAKYKQGPAINPRNIGMNASGVPNVWTLPLAQVKQGSLGLSPILSTTFNNHLRDFSLLQGIDYPAATGNHYQTVYSASSSLADQPGYAPRIPWTIDAVLGNSSRVYRSTPPLKVLRLNPRVGGSSQYFFAGNRLRAEPSYGATLAEAWNLVKGHINPTSPTSPANHDSLKRRYLIDQFLAEFKAVAKGKHASREDQRLLENATDNLTDLQRRLASANVDVVSAPTSRPELPNVGETANNEEFNRRLIDIMTTAMAYNVTRVATYNFNWQSCAADTAVGDFHASWGVHQCHLRKERAFDRNVSWWRTSMKKYAYMIERMRSLGLLDKSLIMMTSDYSSSNGQHHGLDMPVLMAGSLNGKFRQGEWIDYRRLDTTPLATTGIWDTWQWRDSQYQEGRWQKYPGRPINELFMSIFAAAGVPASEYQCSYTDIAYNVGTGAYVKGDLIKNQGFGEDPATLRMDPLWPYEGSEITKTRDWYAANYKEGRAKTLPYFYRG